MSLTFHKPAPNDTPAVEPKHGALAQPRSPGNTPAPLLLDISALAMLLSRSVPSLRRDDAAGRLPAALRIGGAKRWRFDEIRRWVEAGCPDRKTWNAMND